MSEEQEIEIKTEEVNELLTAVPKWIIRWGVSIIFGIMLLVIIFSYFIKYPETLPASITITTTNPPITLVAKTSGKIVLLPVKNNQSVNRLSTGCRRPSNPALFRQLRRSKRGLKRQGHARAAKL